MQDEIAYKIFNTSRTFMITWYSKRDTLYLQYKGVNIMAKSTISIRVDDKLKKDTEKTLDDMGMNITTAFTIFAKTLVKEQRFPFEITNDPFYSKANQEYLAKVIKKMEENGGKIHDLIDD